MLNEKIITPEEFKKNLEETNFVESFNQASILKKTNMIMPGLMALGQDKILQEKKINTNKKCSVLLLGQTHNNQNDFKSTQEILSSTPPKLAVLERDGNIHPQITPGIRKGFDFDDSTYYVTESSICPKDSKTEIQQIPPEFNQTQRSWLTGMYVANAIMSGCDDIAVIYGENHLPDIKTAMTATLNYCQYPVNNVQMTEIDSCDKQIKKVTEPKPFPEDLNKVKNSLKEELHTAFEEHKIKKESEVTQDPAQLAGKLVVEMRSANIQQHFKANSELYEILQREPENITKNYEKISSYIKSFNEGKGGMVEDFLEGLRKEMVPPIIKNYK